jgi:hypothetical protein
MLDASCVYGDCHGNFRQYRDPTHDHPRQLLSADRIRPALLANRFGLRPNASEMSEFFTFEAIGAWFWMNKDI